MNKYSLCITTYNRYELTVKSFEKVIDHSSIDDIVILDDCSTDDSCENLMNHFRDVEKVRVIRQFNNKGMARNKRDAISYAKNRWVIILDSDNVIDYNYVEALALPFCHTASPLTIFAPDFAMPAFNYEMFAGRTIDTEMAKRYMCYPMFRCFLNTCNYVVHRDTYLQIYEDDYTVKGADTISFNYLWLKAGYSFFIVPKMRYQHLQHEGSGFLADIDYNLRHAREVEDRIMKL